MLVREYSKMVARNYCGKWQLAGRHLWEQPDTTAMSKDFDRTFLKTVFTNNGGGGEAQELVR